MRCEEGRAGSTDTIFGSSIDPQTGYKVLSPKLLRLTINRVDGQQKRFSVDHRFTTSTKWTRSVVERGGKAGWCTLLMRVWCKSNAHIQPDLVHVGSNYCFVRRAGQGPVYKRIADACYGLWFTAQGSRFGGHREKQGVRGYLAHKKQRRPSTLQ